MAVNISQLAYYSVKDIVLKRDLWTFVLGNDHSRFSDQFEGLDMRLTGVEPAHVIDRILT